MDIEFYNLLFKTLLLAIVVYGCTFGFLFLVMGDSYDPFTKGEWLFMSLFPLLTTIIALLIFGVNLTGGFEK